MTSVFLKSCFPWSSSTKQDSKEWMGFADYVKRVTEMGMREYAVRRRGYLRLIKYAA